MKIKSIIVLIFLLQFIATHTAIPIKGCGQVDTTSCFLAALTIGFTCATSQEYNTHATITNNGGYEHIKNYNTNTIQNTLTEISEKYGEEGIKHFKAYIQKPTLSIHHFIDHFAQKIDKGRTALTLLKLTKDNHLKKAVQHATMALMTAAAIIVPILAA